MLIIEPQKDSVKTALPGALCYLYLGTILWKVINEYSENVAHTNL